MNVLTEEQRQAYADDGYVILQGLLDPPADLDPVLDEYAGVLERLGVQLHAEGAIVSTYSELPFGRRLSRIYMETRRVYAGHFDCTLSMTSVDPEAPIWVGPAVFALLRHERILDVLEDIIGGEIFSNPVQHVRIKPPEQYLPHVYRDERSGRIAGFGVGATPWHQDNGVVLPVADETDMTTVWVAVTDATVENGCLEVIRGSHRQGLLTHCPSDGLGLAVPDAELDLDNVVTCPMQSGDVLFMHRRTCHSSLPNRSDDVRISYDLRQHHGPPDGSRYLSRLRRAQPPRPDVGAARRRALGRVVVRHPGASGRRRAAGAPSLACRRSRLRLSPGPTLQRDRPGQGPAQPYAEGARFFARCGSSEEVAEGGA